MLIYYSFQQQPIRSTSPHVPTISLKPPELSLPKRRQMSPASRRRRTPEPASVVPPSPDRQVVPDLLLARTDSGKTNTDLSESTTTTDDYFTANSGTDSSRRSRSGSYKVNFIFICLFLNDPLLDIILFLHN